MRGLHPGLCMSYSYTDIKFGLNIAFIIPCILSHVRLTAHFLHQMMLMFLSECSVSDLDKPFDMSEYPKTVMTNELMWWARLPVSELRSTLTWLTQQALSLYWDVPCPLGTGHYNTGEAWKLRWRRVTPFLATEGTVEPLNLWLSVMRILAIR